MSVLLKTTGGLIATAFVMGFKKITEYKSLIANLDVKLSRIYSVKIEPLKNRANFLADFIIFNPNAKGLNLQTVGLVKLNRILFYDLTGELIAVAQTNISGLQINSNDSVLFEKIPFSTQLTGGISKLQSFLKNKDSKDLKVILELQVFNKIYKTALK